MSIKLNLVKPISESDYQDSHASELFKVKRNQIIMLKDRGFDVSTELPLLNYRISDFIKFYKEISNNKKASFKVSLGNVYVNLFTGKVIYVYYPETPKDTTVAKKINHDQITEIIKFMSVNNLYHIILISETPLTPDAVKSFEDAPSLRMESFLYDELTYNRNDHFLVPKHVLLTPNEASEYLKKNKLNISNLEAISYLDPISRWYGAVPGQIFRIYRENLSVPSLIDNYVTHRQVTHTGLDLKKK